MADRSNALLRHAAFHEAGHAVARLHVGAPSTPVEIDVSGAGLSHGTGESWKCRSDGQYAQWDLLTVLLAGPVAEARVRRRSLTAILFTSGQGDFLQINDVLAGLIENGFASEKSGWERVESEVREIVRSEWAAIEAVALALLEKGVLTGAEVEACCAAVRAPAGEGVNAAGVRHG
ncbi:hypothetical protein [Hydrogenophaga sp. OTU3427]|uniref:hypothetical protein n=1 Tax=Hydrogenophaga sp. OTU3427 TaxID=3043856 RepID=UPI00313F2C50